MTPQQKSNMSEFLRHPLVVSFVLGGIILSGTSLTTRLQMSHNHEMAKLEMQKLTEQMQHIRTDLNIWYNEHQQFKSYLTNHRHAGDGVPHAVDAWPPSKRRKGN